ncbi:MAG: Omp28-related outer membrane protein, partial [Cryomorphaceae bacterium]|nr:Omp28-related outer membrane protein [Cryomorphaceae bacterium]
WQNSVNTLASLDLFPLQGGQYYVDDVSFDQQPYTILNLNAAMAGLNIGGNIASQAVTPSVTVLNAGTTVINSFDVTLDYNGTQYTQNVTGQSIASLADYVVNFSQITLVPGLNVATATITNVNGGADDDLTDNSMSINVNPVVPAPGKMVVGEEGTGTWCQWCPRGAVYMDLFEQNYGQFWAGIAVHNSDPMTVTEYDAGVGAVVSGYPSALVDRGPDVDPSGMGPDFYARLQTAPVAFITNGANWDPVTRILNVSVTTDFQASATSNYKVACVLTEDGVTGTGSGYNQSNAYAGGANGVMGGYETLANPVPAAQMTYDHVARAIAPSFGGYANAFPATVNSGDLYTFNFSFTLPATWDEANMHIIGMLVAPNGRIDNAGKATIAEAVSSGFVSGTQVASVAQLEQPDAVMQVFPNPAVSQATVVLNLNNESEVSLKLMDVSGKVLSSRSYGMISGAVDMQLNMSMLSAGVYVIEAEIDGNKITKRIVKE